MDQINVPIITKPTVGGDIQTWGLKININYENQEQFYLDVETAINYILENMGITRAELQDLLDEGELLVTELSGKIVDGSVLLSQLNNTITIGSTLDATLNNTITTANTANGNLNTAITNANNANTTLNDTITTAGTTKTALDLSISNASTAKVNLDNAISNATTSQSNLETATTNANTANSTLTTTTGTANTTNTTLLSTTSTANTAKVSLDASISTATTLQGTLDASIVTGTQLKNDIDAQIAGGDLLVKGAGFDDVTYPNIKTLIEKLEQYTDAGIASLVDSAPATLDTLNELANALGDDPNFATTTTNLIASKLNKGAVSEAYNTAEKIENKIENLSLKVEDNNYHGYKILRGSTLPNSEIIPNGTSYWLSSSEEGWATVTAKLGTPFVYIECHSQYGFSGSRGVMQILRQYKPQDSKYKYGIRFGSESTWGDIIYVDQGILDKERLVYGDVGRAKSKYLNKILDINESGFYAYQMVDDPNAPGGVSGYITATAYSSSSIGLIFVKPYGRMQFSSIESGVVGEWKDLANDEEVKVAYDKGQEALDVVNNKIVTAILSMDYSEIGSFKSFVPPSGVESDTHMLISIEDQGTSLSNHFAYKYNFSGTTLNIMANNVINTGGQGNPSFVVTFIKI